MVPLDKLLGYYNDGSECALQSHECLVENGQLCIGILCHSDIEAMISGSRYRRKQEEAAARKSAKAAQ
jgi:hypothetical protein